MNTMIKCRVEMEKKILTIIIVGILLLTNNIIINQVNSFAVSEKNQKNLKFNKYLSEKASVISDLKPGDILFHISQYITIHCLIFKQFNVSNNMYEFLEANSDHGVRRIFYSENTLNNTLIYKKFARVETANSIQIQNAILFAESQIGKEFEWDMFFHNKNYIPSDPEKPYSNSWYCTELVWAAYYNCNHTVDEEIYGEGIDIDRNKWKKDSLIWSMVWPNDILWDDDIKVFYLRKNKIKNSNDNFLLYNIFNSLKNKI